MLMSSAMKSISVIIFVLLNYISAFSQKIVWEIGLIGGPARANVYGNFEHKNFNASNAILDTSRLTFSLGAISEATFNKHFSVTTAILYERKEYWRWYYDDNGGSGTPPSTESLHEIRWGYVTIPLSLKFLVGEKLKFFVEAGGFGGLQVTRGHATRAVVGYDDGTEVTDMKMKKSNSYNRWEGGVSFGVGMKAQINNVFNLSLIANDRLGLTEVIKYPLSNIPVKNNFFSVSLAITYRFGKRGPNRNGIS